MAMHRKSEHEIASVACGIQAMHSSADVICDGWELTCQIWVSVIGEIFAYPDQTLVMRNMKKNT